MSAPEAVSRYLRAHALGARGGVELFARAARSQLDPENRARLRALAADVAADRRALRGLMRSMGVRMSPLAEMVPVLAERLGRLKPNGSLRHRTHLSDLVELETMTAAVQAKRLGWEALLEIADGREGLERTELEQLIVRAKDQEVALDRMRLDVVRTTLGGEGAS